MCINSINLNDKWISQFERYISTYLDTPGYPPGYSIHGHQSSPHSWDHQSLVLGTLRCPASKPWRKGTAELHSPRDLRRCLYKAWQGPRSVNFVQGPESSSPIIIYD